MSATTRADVVVIGAGLAGCLAGLELARAGRRTVVVEASPDHAEPLLGHVPSGPALAYVDAAERWGRPGARELWELQRDAHAALRELLNELGQDCAYRRAGGFTLATERPEGLALEASEDLLREDGFVGEFLDGYMLEARFAVRGFAAGYWAEGDAELDAEALARAAAEAAREAGAVFREPVAAERHEVSREGVLAVTAQGQVKAPVAVLATPAAAPMLVPYFRERIEVMGCRGIRVPVREEASVPSPARARGGRAGWTLAAGQLRLQVIGGDPAGFATEHLPELAGPHEGGGSRPAGVSRDGLPWVGPVPDLPVVAALGGGGDLMYAPLVSRWAASALLTGRDATPPRLRAARPAPAV